MQDINNYIDALEKLKHYEKVKQHSINHMIKELKDNYYFHATWEDKENPSLEELNALTQDNYLIIKRFSFNFLFFTTPSDAQRAQAGYINNFKLNIFNHVFLYKDEEENYCAALDDWQVEADISSSDNVERMAILAQLNHMNKEQIQVIYNDNSYKINEYAGNYKAGTSVPILEKDLSEFMVEQQDWMRQIIQENIKNSVLVKAEGKEIEFKVETEELQEGFDSLNYIIKALNQSLNESNNSALERYYKEQEIYQFVYFDVNSFNGIVQELSKQKEFRIPYQRAKELNQELNNVNNKNKRPKI